MVTDSDPRAVSVLLVDDEADIRELARLFLEAGGLLVSEAVDGIQALDRYAALNPPPTPSVVVLDNRMPGMSGIEVAREMLAIHPAQVIVLFSAHLDPEIEESATAIGVTACVSKTELRRLPGIINALAPAA